MTLTADQVLFEKAKRHIPGGVNSPVRAFAGWGVHLSLLPKQKGHICMTRQGVPTLIMSVRGGR